MEPEKASASIWQGVSKKDLRWFNKAVPPAESRDPRIHKPCKCSRGRGASQSDRSDDDDDDFEEYDDVSEQGMFVLNKDFGAICKAFHKNYFF